MPDNVINFVKSLSIGPCGCYRTGGSCSISCVSPYTSFVPAEPAVTHYDPGYLVRCQRCRARAALEDDGVDYEKDDGSDLMIISNSEITATVPAGTIITHH